MNKIVIRSLCKQGLVSERGFASYIFRTFCDLRAIRGHIVDAESPFQSNVTKARLFASNSWGRMMMLRGFRSKSVNPEIENVTKTKLDSKSQVRPQQKEWKNSSDGKQGFLPFALRTSLYTAGFTAVVFGGCAVWQFVNAKKHHEEFWKRGLQKRTIKKRGETRNDLNDIWKHLSGVHKVTYGIIGVNLFVLAAWKLASTQVMTKWFTLMRTDGPRRYITMLTSMFSHKSVIHFYVNMYVLSSFCVVWNQLARTHFGNSSINSWERYLAFYLSAGICGSFLSVVVKTIGRIPNPSLGASGAIIGLIGYTCEKMPNNLLAIVFIPNFTFSADSAKKFMIGFDSIGLLIGAFSLWKYTFIDHAGHLGGMIFGIWYARYGEKLLDKWSQFVMNQWRGKS